MLSKSLFTIALLFTLTFTALSNDKSEGYNVGDQVSDFVIANYDGNQYSIAENGAKGTVVIFFSTECPFVQPYTDRLNNLQKEFGEKGITIWAINSNNTESTDEVMNHAKEKGYNFPVLKDDKSVVADQFGATRTPEVFFIDNSSMTVVYHGRIDDNKVAEEVTSNDLQNALNDFLAGNVIAVNETKAFGCSIKK